MTCCCRETDEVYADKRILVFPEGPIGCDGDAYRYSKGERLYLDRLAMTFREVILVSLVLRQGDPYYDTVIHSAFTARNLRVIELPRSKGGAGVLAKMRHFAKVFAAMGRAVPQGDLLYLFLPSYPSAMAWLWGRILGKPHIVYGADDWEQASPGMFKWPHLRGGLFYRLYCGLNRRMERAIVSSARFAVAAGGKLIAKYQAFGATVRPTTPRSTLSEADVFLRDDTCEGEQITLLNVGTLYHDKAQHLLIEAFAGIAGRHPALRLEIVGDGERRPELGDLAQRLGVADRVSFSGYVEDIEALYDIYRGSDIFVLSSVSEGFPRVLYEAMTLGLPIVTTSCGGIPQLMIDGENALVVPVGSAPALAEAVDRLLADGELRRRLIEGGRDTMTRLFKTFDHAQIARMHREFIEGVPDGVGDRGERSPGTN